MPDLPFTAKDRRSFKTPSRAMAATITLILLLLYGFILLTPAFLPDVVYDPGLETTLQTLVVVGVTFYIGTSNSNANKDDTIAHQATEAIKAVAGQVAAPPNGTDAPVSTIQKVAEVTDAAAIPVKVGASDIEVKIDDVVVPKEKP